MCGRYTIYTKQDELEDRFQAAFFDAAEYQPHFNAAPSQWLPIIRSEHPREIILASWGFVPHWTARPAPARPQINARGETAAEKPMFRDAFARRHCLIPANGFYEWERKGSARTPYYITLKGGRPFAFAGIWGVAESGGRPVPTFAILTTAANELVSTIHDRMPVMLSESDEQTWLAEDTTPEAVASLIAPLNPSLMTMYRVSPQMNTPRFESPLAIEPLTAG